MTTIGKSEPRSAHSDYLLANSGREADTRFAALSDLFDDVTIHHLKKCGVGCGWHCLEVGAGGGSIARWLAHHVGRTGHVLATDIDTRFLESIESPNLEVRRHDIAVDSLPQGLFDLVHSRLVLLHVPHREQALARMISGLKPGGWILCEEYDSASMQPDSAVSPGEVLLRTHVAMMSLLEDGGVDRRYGRLLFGRLRTHGLVDVGAEARAFMWQRGSAGVAMLRANFEQLREAMIRGNHITSQQFDDDVARLDDPDFMVPSGILWSVWGRRQ
jgi:SAM-dependent methyltransferase